MSKLLTEYQDYEGFVAQAFLPQPGPSNYDAVSIETWPLALEGKNLHVWHSRDDELLSFKQTIDAILYLDDQLGGCMSSKATNIDIPKDGDASTTTVNGVKESVASVYGKVTIKSSDKLHADLITLRVSSRGCFWLMRHDDCEQSDNSQINSITLTQQGKHDDLLHTETFWNLILQL